LKNRHSKNELRSHRRIKRGDFSLMHAHSNHFALIPCGAANQVCCGRDDTRTRASQTVSMPTSPL
jgi:hypothetical protein